MVCRFLEKRVEIDCSADCQRPENTIELEYYLVESDCVENCDMEAQRCYGIEIVKKYQGKHNESKKYTDVYSTRVKTENLIALLVENAVTPISLPYILDDLLGS